MPTATYPGGIWSPTIKTDKVDLVNAEHMNATQREIKAVQTELGADVAGSKTDLVTRLAVILADSGAVAQGTGFPGSPIEGQPFYRIDTDILYIYDGSAWDSVGVFLGYAAGGILSGSYPDPSISAILKEILYFCNPDYNAQAEVVSFGIADKMLLANAERSYLRKTITWANLTSADLVTGKVSRQAIDFNGADESASIADDAAHDVGSACSIEAWVYRDTAGGTDCYFCEAAGAILHLSLLNATVAGAIVTASGTETINATHGLSGNAIDQWVHIVMTWDSSSAAKVYINGVDKSGGNDAGNGAISAFNQIYIGQNNTPANWFHGIIDGVRYLNYKMSAAEVLARYNAFK